MKPYVLVFSFIWAGILLSSCETVTTGNGAVLTENREASGFNKITYAIAGELLITQGDHYEVSVKGQQNILKELETSVMDGTLEIHYKPGVHIGNHKKIMIYITLPGMKALTLTGSGNIHVARPFTTDKLALQITGSGNILMQEVNARSIEADLEGSGYIQIGGGSAEKTNLEIEGSGDVDFSGMHAQQASVEITGSGDAKVQAAEKLDVEITGSGNVYYSGKPQINISRTGSGNIAPLR